MRTALAFVVMVVIGVCVSHAVYAVSTEPERITALRSEPINNRRFLEAARTGIPQQVSEAIRAGADLAVRDEGGSVVLMVSTLNNRNASILSDPDARAESGQDLIDHERVNDELMDQPPLLTNEAPPPSSPAAHTGEIRTRDQAAAVGEYAQTGRVSTRSGEIRTGEHSPDEIRQRVQQATAEGQQLVQEQEPIPGKQERRLMTGEAEGETFLEVEPEEFRALDEMYQDPRERAKMSLDQWERYMKLQERVRRTETFGEAQSLSVDDGEIRTRAQAAAADRRQPSQQDLVGSLDDPSLTQGVRDRPRFADEGEIRTGEQSSDDIRQRVQQGNADGQAMLSQQPSELLAGEGVTEQSPEVRMERFVALLDRAAKDPMSLSDAEMEELRALQKEMESRWGSR